MHDTERALLAAVAARRADRRTSADARAELLIAAFAISMTAIAIHCAVRMILARV